MRGTKDIEKRMGEREGEGERRWRRTDGREKKRNINRSLSHKGIDPVDRITYAFWLMEHDTVKNYRFQQTPVRGARSSDARSKITPSAWPTTTALNT